MKALLLPLDERPCNRVFPQMIAADSDIELSVPDSEILGRKKTPSHTEEINAYLKDHAGHCDSMILSVDQLLYGGLLPSRIHHQDKEELEKNLEVLKELKKINPSLKIYAFQCIMRCPQYSSSEEEPDYYEQYGHEIFRHGWLQDKKNREGLSEEEEKELSSIQIPAEICRDYEKRRSTNIALNERTLEYLQNGIIDFLVIPQDDSSPYGYTAIDQKKILKSIEERHLQNRTMVYPGADEVGMSLLTRACNEYRQQSPAVYPFYASVNGPSIIPLYEDREMYESLKSHVMVTGAHLSSEEKADIILAVNCPGKFMQESFAKAKDSSYSADRNLMWFVSEIERKIQEGKKVALCDSAYANGGDRQLIELLDQKELLDRLFAYAGWNTNCNTLGTVLSQSQITNVPPIRNTVYRILEDVFYQAEIRMDIVENVLPGMGLSYYDFKDRETDVEREIENRVVKEYEKMNLSKKHPLKKIEVYMPWHRMFEIGMHITLQ
jgi:hypothetical protein